MRDIENEFVADMVAECVVDVFEMIEVDVKYRRRRAAVAHLGNGALKALCEIYAVGQSANRVVHCEMA